MLITACCFVVVLVPYSVSVVCYFVGYNCRMETIPGTPSYKATMKLTICNVQKSDYGGYKCVAKNPRGITDGTIKLYSK